MGATILDIKVPQRTTSRQRAAADHHVYLIEFEGPQFIKVGRTRNLERRMRQHEQTQGCAGRYFAQMKVASEAEAVELEAAMIREMSARFPRQKNEWFDLPLRDVAEVIKAVTDRVPFPVSTRGASTSFFEDRDDMFREARAEGFDTLRANKRWKH